MIFDADFGLCLSYLRTLGPKRNLDHRSFFCLDCLLMRSSKLLLFSKDVRFNSGVRLLLELYCVFVIEHVVFFTIWAKLTVAFTCTFEPLFGSGCGFGFEQKFWRIDGFGGKKARIGGFAYAYSTLSERL